MSRLFRKFFRSEQGSAMLMVGLGSTMLLAAAGIAIDMGRVQVVQSRLSSALDAAGLAAGSTIHSSEPTTVVNKYFYANYPTGFMGSSITPPLVTVSEDNMHITLEVHGTVPTTFMRVFGISSLNVNAASEITRANMGMELALVIDTTGSMSESAGGGQSKIQAARDAATSLVNILYGDQTTIDNLWIGLVPFAHQVNVGPNHSNWTGADSFDWGPTTWMGCVDAREANGRDTTDDPPGLNATFPKFYWSCEPNNKWYGTNPNRDNCLTGSGLRYKTPLSTSRGPNKGCFTQIMTPMTANKNTVLSAISTLQPNGNTHIVLGAVWGWRMLSPRWRNIWGGEMDVAQLPQDYDTPLMNKVMILMTDGDNTIDNNTRGAYGYLSEGRLGTTSSSAAVTQLNNRLQTVCTRMKENGIIIYTIAFGTGISSTAQNMLRSCASNPDYYFYSPSGAALQDAFHQIGDSLANLRVSQ